MADTNTYSTRQAAEVLDLSQSTVQRMADEGTIPSYRTPGGFRRLDAGAVQAAIADLAETVDRDAVSARFGVAGSGLGGVVPGQDGRELGKRKDRPRTSEPDRGAWAGCPCHLLPPPRSGPTPARFPDNLSCSRGGPL